MEDIIKKSIELQATTIIPNFGAFMRMGNAVLFNEFLKYDDGKLTALIQSEKGIDSGASKDLIEDWIEKSNKTLDSGKELSISGLGVLSKVSGKLKFVYDSGVVDAVVSEKETTQEEIQKETKSAVKKEKLVQEVKEEKAAEKPKKEKKKEKEKKEVKTGSLAVKASEAVEHIKTISTKDELLKYSKDDKRKTVVAALNKRLDGFNKKLDILAGATTTEVKAPKKDEIFQEDSKQVKLEDNKIEDEEKEEKLVPEIKNKTVHNSEEKISEIEEKIEEKKEEIKEVVKEVAPPVVLIEKETPTIKEKAEKLTKECQKEPLEEKEIVAIAASAQATEEDIKKRKKRRMILWMAILFLFIGIGTFGFLKKDIIVGWFAKEHEPKEIVDNTSKNLEEEVTANSDDHLESIAVVTEPEKVVEENHNVSEEVTPELDEFAEEEIEVEPEVEKPMDTPVSTGGVSGSYHVVAGSFSQKSNAENKVQSLKEMGYSNANILGEYNGLFTVRVSSFESKDDAKQFLSEFTGAGNKGFVKKL